MVPLDALLAEIAQDPPCGPNLEYDPDFLALEKAAGGEPERQTGSAIVAAKEPEWPDVRDAAQALLLRTKDLRVAILLSRALVRTEGFGGLATGLGLIGEYLSRYWDKLHPALDDDGDPTMRLNALTPLADPGPISDPDTILRDVRNLVLVDAGAHGRVTVRDVLVALKRHPPSPGSTVPELGRLIEIVRSEGRTAPELTAAITKSGEALKAIVAVLNDKAPNAPIPDVRLLQEAISAASRVFQSEAEAEAAGAADAESVQGSTTAALGEIRNRDDAMRHLDRVCEFLQRSEPAHPAPLLIRRAQRLLTKNFVEIIEDLAPGSVGEIQKIAGLETK